MNKCKFCEKNCYGEIWVEDYRKETNIYFCRKHRRIADVELSKIQEQIMLSDQKNEILYKGYHLKNMNDNIKFENENESE